MTAEATTKLVSVLIVIAGVLATTIVFIATGESGRWLWIPTVAVLTANTAYLTYRRGNQGEHLVLGVMMIVFVLVTIGRPTLSDVVRHGWHTWIWRR